MFNLSDYDYELPHDRIAQDLASPADSAKLLVYDKKTHSIQDRVFYELPWLVPEWSHFFFNTSKVVKARIALPEFDGEIFFLEKSDDECIFEALVRPGKKMKPWQTIYLEQYSFEIIGMTEHWRRIKSSHPILEILESIWQMPLPPYIWYEASKSDSYQPIQAKHPGSVAAPTASLHFTDKTLKDLEKHTCTLHEVVLHIGLGTFKQVDTESIQDYAIHSEHAEVTTQTFESIASINTSQKNLIAVWTTVTRTLETLPYIRVLLYSSSKTNTFTQETQHYRDTITKGISLEQAQTYVKSRSIQWSSVDDIHENHLHRIQFESTLYIYPWFDFRVINQLITNFHLPKSSLLMLVAWFIWYDQMMKLYSYAIENDYQFFSFGDAMILK